MSEERPANLQLQKCASSRRSRKDQEGRDFQCGCALYTHIKTKHDGKQPQGTQKTGNNIVIKKSKGKSQQQSLKGIYNNLQLQDVRILKQTLQDYYGQVPVANRIKKQNLPKQIYQCYVYLMKHQQYNLNKQSSLDQIFTIYLLNIGQFVNEKLYDYYIVFTKLARSCFMKYGEQIHARCFSNKLYHNYIQFFTITNVKYFPIICDFFVRYFIQFDQSAAEYKNINKSMIELIIYDFCDWLVKKKLTSIKCNMKKEYKHYVKPNPLIKKSHAVQIKLLQQQNIMQKVNEIEKENQIKENELRVQENKIRDEQPQQQIQVQMNMEQKVIQQPQRQALARQERQKLFRQEQKAGEMIDNLIKQPQGKQDDIMIEMESPDIKQANLNNGRQELIQNSNIKQDEHNNKINSQY